MLTDVKLRAALGVADDPTTAPPVKDERLIRPLATVSDAVAIRTVTFLLQERSPTVVSKDRLRLSL